MSTRSIHDSDSAREYGSTLLRGDRITLHATTDEDIQTLVEWWQLDEWAMLQQTTVVPRASADIAAMFAQWSKNDQPGGVGLSVRNEAGALIGHATLWGGSLPSRIATFAIIIGPPFVGKGYGPDVTSTMLRYGFDELGLHKIELQALTFNTHAIRAYEKAGFVREGVRRSCVFHGGTYFDQVHMGILEQEYRARS